MAEYRNKVTGSLVSVADDLVLGTDYELVGSPKAASKPAPAKKQAEAVETAPAGDSE